jgi:hypothetical protein
MYVGISWALGAERSRFDAFRAPPVKNTVGLEVGRLAVSVSLERRLIASALLFAYLSYSVIVDGYRNLVVHAA